MSWDNCDDLFCALWWCILPLRLPLHTFKRDCFTRGHFNNGLLILAVTLFGILSSGVTLHTLTPVFFRCVGRWGLYTTHQDGGFVAKDLCTPVQCGEDDAVWAIHASVWCLQNHQRESPRSPDRTRLVDDSENAICIVEIYKHPHLHAVFHFVLQRQIMASSCLTMIPGKESGSSLEEPWITTCCEME